MNKDKAEGMAKSLSGKIQKAAGQITGNRTQEIKGLIKETEGAAQSRVGEAKEVLEDAREKLTKRSTIPHR